MIRWRFILVRVLVIGAALMALRWGLGPVAKYAAIAALQSSTGAAVEIRDAQVGLFPPRVWLSGVQIADPRSGKSMRDAFRAESIDLMIDGQALLHRRWVVQSGRVRGLRVGSRRATSGHLPEPNSEASEPARGASTLQRLLATTTESLGQQASELLGDLATVRRSQKIRERWRAEHASLVQRARELEQEIRSIHGQADGIDNPLRDWPELKKTLARAREARAELVEVRHSIEQLPERLKGDLESLEEAKEIDLARVAQYVPVELSESDDVGVELLTQAIRGQLQRARRYFDTGRALAGYTVIAPDNQRHRGVDHDFVGSNRRPGLLMRHCEINGTMRAGGQRYELTGILNNLTPTPQWLAEPTRARLRLEGPELVRVEYLRDRRPGRHSDRLTLHWPKTDAKSMQLGGSDAGIAIAGGTREVWIQLHRRGEQLQGRLVSKRVGLRMTLHAHPDYAESPAASSLSDSLASIDQLEVDARFDGTWENLALHLDTNLGDALSEAAHEAVAEQVQASQNELIAKIHEVHLEQTEQLRGWLDAQQSEARALLASADKSVEEISQQVLREVGGSEAYLGSLRSSFETRLK